MKCPHCKKGITTNNVPDLEKAKKNADNYGGSDFCFQCPHCQGKFGVPIERFIRVLPPYPVDKNRDLSY